MNWTALISGSEFRVQRLHDAGQAQIVLDTPDRLVEYLLPQLANSPRYSEDNESLGVIHLNTRRRPIGFEIITIGTLDTLLVHARSVFRSAIITNAAALVVFHNHPSGDPTPSEADIRITRDLIRAGQLLKIEVLDHVILGKYAPDRAKAHASLRELGYFYTS